MIFGTALSTPLFQCDIVSLIFFSPVLLILSLLIVSFTGGEVLYITVIPYATFQLGLVYVYI